MSPHDASGWSLDPIAAWPVTGCYSLLSADPSSRLVEARLAHQAGRFFDATLRVTPTKDYPSGGEPIRDAGTLWVATQGNEPRAVEVQTMPLDHATGVRQAALEAAAAMGGAGMDKLALKATRLWQLRALEGPDDAAALLATAILTSIVLAPVLPPEGGALFGVKGARERLERALQAAPR